MGYNVSQCGSKFKMKKENTPAAWAALKDYCNQPCEFKIIQRWFQEAATQDCFEDSLGVLGFAIGSSSRSTEGDYDEIEFANEAWSGYEAECLSSIAPFVEEGSYMEFRGEDGDIWRLVFSAGKAEKVRPTLTWDKPSTGINIKTKEDVLALDAAMDRLEERIKEVAEYLGYIDNVWRFESMSIGKNDIYVTTYDLYYDLHDTKTGVFPIECLFDDELLKNHKRWLEEEEKARELREQQEEQRRQEEKERAEYERLKEKFEPEPEAEPEQEM